MKLKKQLNLLEKGNSKGENMIIKTTVQKTVQEANYEPILISTTIEKEIEDANYKKEVKELRYMVQKEVKTAMMEWLESDD